MNIFVDTKTKRYRQSGFSLIEVLVTVLVVGVGLMGLIALMIKGMQASSDSAMRSIASAQAYDMADRVRANIKGFLDNGYSAVVPPGSTSSCPIDDDELVVPPDPDALESCASTDMASADKCQWHKDNARLLPSGAGAICEEAAGNSYAIHIAWDDEKKGSPTTKFILRFEP